MRSEEPQKNDRRDIFTGLAPPHTTDKIQKMVPVTFHRFVFCFFVCFCVLFYNFHEERRQPNPTLTLTATLSQAKATTRAFGIVKSSGTAVCGLMLVN